MAHVLEYFVPFEDITPGDTGFIGDLDNCENAFKIYQKCIGRKWYEEIMREYRAQSITTKVKSTYIFRLSPKMQTKKR